jgi:hypothetical protein
MFNRVPIAFLMTLALASGAAAAATAGPAAGYSRLIDAARNHDLKTTRSLIGQHVDVNARSDGLQQRRSQKELRVADFSGCAGKGHRSPFHGYEVELPAAWVQVGVRF